MCELRRAGFFYLDQLRGGTVKKAYQRLKTFDSLDSHSPQVLQHQQSALRNLLKHAADTTKFYSSFKDMDLKDFPVINKDIIKTQQNSFLSKKYKKENLTVMFTSGSTGIPFSSYQDKIKKKHVNAELIYYSEKAGYQLGKNLTYIRGATQGNYRTKFKQWLHNETLILVSKLDDITLEKITEKINSGSESTILGYASTYSSLKNYFDRNGCASVNKAKVKGIISNGEMILDDTRETIEKAFNCRCYSRYSNQENGVIGQDDTENNIFLLNEAHYIVEILKMDTDEPAEKGEVGRIVLTDLYNYAMPMIRYDTGDIGSIKYLKQGDITKKTIDDFGGRKRDMIFDCKGNHLYSSVLSIGFDQFPEVRQFQFIQESPVQYRIKINTSNEFKGKDELVKWLKDFLGQEAEIAIEHVDEIPILESGKRKMVINLMD